MSTHVSVSLAGIVMVLLVASIVCNCVQPNADGAAAGAGASYRDCVGQWVRVRYGAEDIEHVAEGKLINVDDKSLQVDPWGIIFTRYIKEFDVLDQPPAQAGRRGETGKNAP